MKTLSYDPPSIAWGQTMEKRGRGERGEHVHPTDPVGRLPFQVLFILYNYQT
jgi:hypothetical protein